MRSFIIMLIAFWPVCALLAQEFSLEEAINYASENSNTAKFNDLNYRDAEARIKETTAIGLPKLNGSINYNYNYKIQQVVIPDFMDPSQTQTLEFGVNHGASAGLDFNQLLFDAQYIYGLRAARAYRGLVSTQSDLSMRDVRYQVAQAYLAAWIIGENLSIVQKNIDNLQSTLDETIIIYENGFAEKLDIDRLQLSVRSLQTQYNNLERNYQLALDQLKVVMNYPITENIALTEDFTLQIDQIKAMDVSPGLGIDLSNRPEMAVFTQQELINDINVKRLKGGYIPNLVLFANYRAFLNRNDLFNGSEPGWLGAGAVGAQINVPIFDGYEKKAGIERARLNLENVLTRKAQFEHAATAEIRNARMRLFNAQQSLNESESNLELAEEIYRVTKIKYNEGVGSSLETTQAESEVYGAQSQVLQAKYNLFNAHIDLEKALGRI